MSLWTTHIIRPSSLHGPLSYRSSSPGFLLWFLEFPCWESVVLFPFKMLWCHRASRDDRYKSIRHFFYARLFVLLFFLARLPSTVPRVPLLREAHFLLQPPRLPIGLVFETLLTTILQVRRHAMTGIFTTSKSRKICTSTHLQPLRDWAWSEPNHLTTCH